MEIEKLSQQGYDALSKGNYEKALSCWNEVLSLEPNNADAYINRGNTYAVTRHWDQAIKNYNEAIRLNPNYGLAYGNRGNTHYQKGELDEAMTDWSKAIQLNPNNAEIYYSRAGGYQTKKIWDKAIEDDNEAIRLSPNWPDVYYERGNAYRAKGDWNNAISDWNETIRLNPKVSEPLNSLAWLLATCPNPLIRNGAKAVEAATKACDLSEWKKWNHVGTLGAAYAEADDFAQAIKYQTQSMNMEGISEKYRIEAQQRLDLYKQQKPYHA
ncbi:MAG: tetratricopeptide repeat protein [Limisphaerales bacterium]